MFDLIAMNHFSEADWPEDGPTVAQLQMDLYGHVSDVIDMKLCRENPKSKSRRHATTTLFKEAEMCAKHLLNANALRILIII